jgi:hypothetical protein
MEAPCGPAGSDGSGSIGPGHVWLLQFKSLRAVVKNMVHFEPFILRKVAANGTYF